MYSVKNITDYVPDEGIIFTEESQTRQSDYEDINTMVARIIRGEILPQMPDEFEYDDTDDVEEIYDAEHPLDVENLDVSDFGSVYQDDVRAGIDAVLNSIQSNQRVINRSESGAEPISSSSDANVPVDNLTDVNSKQ